MEARKIRWVVQWPRRCSAIRAVAGALILAWCATLVGCSEKPPRRGIVLITLDTARGDRFDWSRPDEFPSIKALFADGVRFDQAISASPVTGPAHASIFTGLSPTEHGVLSNPLSLALEQTTLAERLKALGYQTAGFVSCGILRRGRGFEQGFEHYDATLYGKYARVRSAKRTTDRAIEWLDQFDERPFFLWLHYFDAHAPYAPPLEFRPEGYADLVATPGSAPTLKRLQRIHKNDIALSQHQVDYYRALYRGELEFIDQQVGRLHSAIDAYIQKPENASAITYVLTADHGEELAEHMNFFEHNLSLYDGVVRVPLAIRSPGLEAERVASQVDPASIVASVLELIGQPVPGEITPSLFSTAGRGQPRVSAKELHSFVRPWAVTLRMPPWKYFYWEDGREELYNIVDDPGEQSELARRELDQLEIMRNKVRREVLPSFATPEVEDHLKETIDPPTREMLKALGYSVSRQQKLDIRVA